MPTLCWTFAMSCVISSAVCCAIFVTSMSGIALGYNYSLAEYIDLKETNVSVYIKRGVFDDEIADDIGWRRSGDQLASGLSPDKNSITGAPEGEIDENKLAESGRRMDDSIFESDDKNQYEGSLMKLTARPPFMTSKSPAIKGLPIQNIREQHEGNTLEQLKDIKAFINMRKSGGGLVSGKDKKTRYEINDRYLEFAPSPPVPAGPGREPMPLVPVRQRVPVNPRDAVPDDSINEEAKWYLPKESAESVVGMIPDEFAEIRPTYPSPVTYRQGPVRPPTIRYKSSLTPTLTEIRISAPTPKAPESESRQDMDDRNINQLKEDMMFENMKGEEFMKMRGGSIKSEGEEYDDVKGLPVRKRRSIIETKLDKLYINTLSNNSKSNKGIKCNVCTDNKNYKINDSKLVTVLRQIAKNVCNNTVMSRESTEKNDLSTNKLVTHITEIDKIKTFDPKSQNFAYSTPLDSTQNNKERKNYNLLFNIMFFK